jgi:glycosyltransferase involved in cell wall biosynthesis
VYARRSNASLIFENPDDAACLQRYGLPKGADITFVGGAGIDPDQYPPQPHHDRKPVHVAFVGRLLAIKGVDLLVAAIKLLHQNGIEVVLDIYGVPDPANPTSYSLQQIKAWTALPYVQWHGQTADIVAVWNKAAICVVPSRAGDGLPRALLEAASCARPLVVSDVPGCRYFVRNGVEGLVVPPEDVPALAEAIKKLVNNATLRRRMGMAARERVLSQFTKDHIVATVSGIYKDLLCSIKEGGRG